MWPTVPVSAFPEVVTWSTGQVGYSHCFWCGRELVLGDWRWGCANCNADNFSCATALRRGQGAPVHHVKDLEWAIRKGSDWTPAGDVVVP